MVAVMPRTDAMSKIRTSMPGLWIGLKIFLGFALFVVAIVLLASVLEYFGAGEQNQAAWILIWVVVPAYLVRRVFDSSATFGVGWMDFGILLVFYFAVALLVGKVWIIIRSKGSKQ
jgi:hypothetical protein